MWSQYGAEIYMMEKRPVNGSYDYRLVEEKAHEAMKDNRGAWSAC
jgi:hypothetical protein